MIFILLAVYQIKHFLADYPLQGAYMLKKFLGGWQWVLPLAAHAGVHGLFTLAICFFVNPALWWLSLVDFSIHFTMDRIKASPNLLGRFKALAASEFKQVVVDATRVCQVCQSVEAGMAKGYKEKTIRSAIKHTNERKQEAIKQLKSNTYFWWALGFDQMIHHLTHYYLIWMLVS